jgi:hypothetical protein
MGEMKPYSNVKFRGVATTDEDHGSTVCYGSYFYKVRVEEILSDPDAALEIGKEYTFVTGKIKRGMEITTPRGPTAKGVKAGNQVEIEGAYWHRGGPMQILFNIVDSTFNEELVEDYLGPTYKQK